jgi:hypothetical protein
VINSSASARKRRSSSSSGWCFCIQSTASSGSLFSSSPLGSAFTCSFFLPAPASPSPQQVFRFAIARLFQHHHGPHLANARVTS